MTFHPTTPELAGRLEQAVRPKTKARIARLMKQAEAAEARPRRRRRAPAAEEPVL